MIKRSDTDRVLRHWLSDGPSTMPDRLVDVVADRISRQPQRHAGRLHRRLIMTPAFKYGIVAAAILVVAVAGYSLVPRNGSIGGPGPTPTATATSTPTPTAAPSRGVTCDNQVGGSNSCAGPLSAGVHTSAVFQPSLSFTVPAGWANRVDISRIYVLHYNFAPAHAFQVISRVAIPDQSSDCTVSRRAGVGNAPSDWVTFLTSHPGLAVSTPEPVTIGGFEGFRLTLAVAASWALRCPNSIGPAVVTMTSAAGEAGWMQMLDDQHDTFTILDVAGQTVIIQVESGPEAGVLDTLNTTFNPVIDTFRFTPGS